VAVLTANSLAISLANAFDFLGGFVSRLLTLLEQRRIQLVLQGLVPKSEIDSSGRATAHV
jgi:hypothetical protein